MMKLKQKYHNVSVCIKNHSRYFTMKNDWIDWGGLGYVRV